MLTFIEWVMVAAPEVSIRFAQHPYYNFFEVAAPDPLEFGIEDFNRDFRRMMKRLIQAGKFEGMEDQAEQAMRQNYGRLLVKAATKIKDTQIFGQDASDVFQEVAIKLWEKLWSKMGVQGDGSVQGGQTWAEVSDGSQDIMATVGAWAKFL